MALANIAEVGQQGMQSTARAYFMHRVSLDLDDSYPSNGYTTLSTLLKAVIGSRFTIVDIRQASPAGGYKLWWDRANDTLLVYQYPTSQGPATEVGNGTNLAAVTSLELVVWSV